MKTIPLHIVCGDFDFDTGHYTHEFSITVSEFFLSSDCLCFLDVSGSKHCLTLPSVSVSVQCINDLVFYTVIIDNVEDYFKLHREIFGD